MMNETVIIGIKSWKDGVEFPPVTRPIAKSKLKMFFPLFLQNVNEIKTESTARTTTTASVLQRVGIEIHAPTARRSYREG